METIADNIRTLKKLDWYFIIVGLFEIFILVFLTSNFFGMILGLITLIPAYIALTEKNINWNYFVGIWSIVKYNPIILIAMIAFVLGDFYRVNGRKVHNESSTDSFMSWDTILAIAIVVLFLLLVLSSFIIGIILITKTVKHNKLKANQLLTETNNLNESTKR
jgi:hypothetical protein